MIAGNSALQWRPDWMQESTEAAMDFVVVRAGHLQNPRIGFHLIGLVTSRLVDDLQIVERQGETHALSRSRTENARDVTVRWRPALRVDLPDTFPA